MSLVTALKTAPLASYQALLGGARWMAPGDSLALGLGRQSSKGQQSPGAISIDRIAPVPLLGDARAAEHK